MRKDIRPDHLKKYSEPAENPDFSLPEAIQIDVQRLDSLSTDVPEQRLPFPQDMSPEHLSCLPALPNEQNSSSRFLQQVRICSEGLEDSSAKRPGLEKAISRYRNQEEAGQLKLAEAIQQLGALSHKEGKWEEALLHYEESLAILRLLPLSEAAAPVSWALKQMGSLHYEMQHLKTAIHCLEEALDLTEKHTAPRSSQEKLEVAAMATLAAAIRMELLIEGQGNTTGRNASQFLTLAQYYLDGLNEEDHLVKKRSEELKYMNRILWEIL